jgi:putative PIN family toxin of toxin-antitoxin system
MRLVLDTNVVASALLWSGVPRSLLQAAREQRVELFTSTPLLAELTDILARPKFAPKIAASLLSVDELVDRYAQLASLVRPTSIPRTAPDPDDDLVLATALAAKADFVVTGDLTLLSVAEYQGVKIVNSMAAVVQITGST